MFRSSRSSMLYQQTGTDCGAAGLRIHSLSGSNGILAPFQRAPKAFLGGRTMSRRRKDGRRNGFHGTFLATDKFLWTFGLC